MTVIVTTHYIEEARQANVVGLMRNGRMLAQDSPDRLLEHYKCESLEDVFLKLCMADTTGRLKKFPEIANGDVEDGTTVLEHVVSEVSIVLYKSDERR